MYQINCGVRRRLVDGKHPQQPPASPAKKFGPHPPGHSSKTSRAIKETVFANRIRDKYVSIRSLSAVQLRRSSASEHRMFDECHIQLAVSINKQLGYKNGQRRSRHNSIIFSTHSIFPCAICLSHDIIFLNYSILSTNSKPLVQSY